uniref:drebrin-like protein B n=1 Tax=Myxine glutinosa TaxID=7769 RepID=UPI003590137E
MAVNLTKNRAELAAAYEDVLSGKSETDWALFTYEGNTNDLKVAETGSNGLEELVDELNSGKVMYAFCRVQDSNSGLTKFVFINWTGEGVKTARKGICALHVSAVAAFLKGAHVSVNARTEDDVDPDTLKAKVAQASGAKYGVHKEASRPGQQAPQDQVRSVYQKTDAGNEILQAHQSKYWEKIKQEDNERNSNKVEKVGEQTQEAIAACQRGAQIRAQRKMESGKEEEDREEEEPVQRAALPDTKPEWKTSSKHQEELQENDEDGVTEDAKDVPDYESPEDEGEPEVPEIPTLTVQPYGLSARAIYDYQAADDSEISFNPDEIISEIEQIDEGWWQGRAPDGHFGMFPANYVELVE